MFWIDNSVPLVSMILGDALVLKSTRSYYEEAILHVIVPIRHKHSICRLNNLWEDLLDRIRR